MSRVFYCREVTRTPNILGNVLSLSANSFGLHVHDRVRVLAEVVGFEPTTYAGVKVLCLEPYLATPLCMAQMVRFEHTLPIR